MMRNGWRKKQVAAAMVLVAMAAGAARTAHAINDVAGEMILFNTNGAWSWFEDERALVDVAAGKILVSSVANAAGTDGATRTGDVDLVALNLATSAVGSPYILNAPRPNNNGWPDDHNSAALWKRPDGRYLAVYGKHGSDSLTRYRISTNPGDASSWSAEQTFTNAIGATYHNLHYLSSDNGGTGRLYNFTRTVGFDPNVLTSNDAGQSWTYGGRLLDWPTPPTSDPKYTGSDGSRPYLKYASNGVDEIHFIASNDHPRAYDNNIFHGVIRGGVVYDSFGAVVDGNLFDGAAMSPTQYTPVFNTDASPLGHAWTTDLQLDAQGRPYALFTARAGNTNVNDHRILYGRFDGAAWIVHEVAKMGGFLYSPENDYTGLGALDPSDPNRLFISTKIDPRTQGAMPRYEIFEGNTTDGGANWDWEPITFNSTMDNLRPIVPKWDDDHTALLWMRGSYSTYTNYNLDIVGLTAIEPLVTFLPGDLDRNGDIDLDDFALYLSGLHTDLSGLPADEAQRLGDLNGDFENNYYDFVLFKNAYDAANGMGTFATAMQTPEPAGLGAMAVSGIGALLTCRSRAQNRGCTVEILETF